MELMQLINTAVIKSTQIELEADLEGKLNKISESPAIKALEFAIIELSNKSDLSKDDAAVEIVSTIKELDFLWKNYLLLEGSGRLKEQLVSTD